ncbi:MAG: hypothetical protein GX881_08365 [Firmicutes bacterium]|nr:hypothetical protein [Bacillota bacterium]
MFEAAGLKFVYEKGIAIYVERKVIDYHTGFLRKGFSIKAAGSRSRGC